MHTHQTLFVVVDLLNNYGNVFYSKVNLVTIGGALKLLPVYYNKVLSFKKVTMCLAWVLWNKIQARRKLKDDLLRTKRIHSCSYTEYKQTSLSSY